VRSGDGVVARVPVARESLEVPRSAHRQRQQKRPRATAIAGGMAQEVQTR
jgi:hypothetical protein